ncbi:uracil-DNA glycosylase family protein [Arenicella xantha]|uniref:Uracil-DNA glycosylase n=1 Tax=Arenicella xantha TaxID=644221 RepID=A0A395JSI1_9GAMM|nr:uracil-DNA glycosylase family protein [Arenicella xantha]RBP53426.1 uracil-DNA glycosylase [Arenicella xantha]
MVSSDPLARLVDQIRACTACESDWSHSARPIIQVDAKASILIAGQAPGSAVHASGIPFDDPSGERLRDWMGIDRDTFYNPRHVAIVPMAFCYPGRGKTGDLAPPKRCADKWREALLDKLGNIQLTLLIGQYAQHWHLPASKNQSLTDTVRQWRSQPNGIMPLPHPSPRNNIWLAKNPWFTADVLPTLQSRVQFALSSNRR